MIQRENLIDENTFNKIHGEGYKHDFIFLDNIKNKNYKKFNKLI